MDVKPPPDCDGGWLDGSVSLSCRVDGEATLFCSCEMESSVSYATLPG